MMETMSPASLQRGRTREPAAPAIEIFGVSKSFGEGRLALDDVSLTAQPGEVLGLLGHNGAGKTTLVRLMAGLLRPTSGRIEVLGHDPVESGSFVRSRLGVLPSGGLLDFRLTARENLEFAAALFDLRPELGHRAQDMLDEFGLSERADERVATFSQGMKQRLGLARVLLPEPRVLLLDEPTSALDPVAARDVRELIRQQSRDREVTVVVCTHDLVEAAEICDRVIILNQGSCLAQGPPAQLASSVAITGAIELEVHPDDLERARVALTGLTVRRYDATRLHVTVQAQVDVPGMVVDLVTAGVRIQAVRPPRATLEDLYLSLHGATGAAATASSPQEQGAPS